MPAGNYIVSIESLDGYQSTGDIDDTEQDKTPGTIAINLGADQNARGLDFLENKLPGEGVISGFVLEDPNGDGDGDDAVAGIEGASIFVIDPATRDRAKPLELTLEDGSFTFTELPEGDYIVAALLSRGDAADAKFTNGNRSELQRFELKTVSVPLETPILFYASYPATIQGFVTDNNEPSNRVSNSRIRLLYPDGSPVHGLNPTYTGSNGAFYFTTYAGDYMLEELDPPGYISYDDSEGSPIDNRISVSVTSGNDSSGHVFINTKINYSISLHRLDETGVINLNKPSGSNPSSFPAISPLLPVNEWAILDIQPPVDEGIVADGVTPLLIKFCSTIPSLDSPVNLRWIVEAISGGTIAEGMSKHMQKRVNGEWTPASDGFNNATLTQIDPCEFALIEALDPASLIFAPGSKEITLLFKILTDDERLSLLAQKRIVVRRLPLLLRSRQPWSDTFIDRVTQHLPLEFLKISQFDPSNRLNKYFPGIQRSWAVNSIDVVVQGGRAFGIIQNLEGDKYRAMINLYRGAYRRVVFIGAPHAGTRLVPYLKELEERLEAIGLDSGVLLPDVDGQRFSWSRFDAASFNPNSVNPIGLNPRGRFFTNESIFDPGSSTFHLVTEINGENARVFRKVGLSGLVLSAVFPFGSDGLVDEQSAKAASNGDNVYNLSDSGPIAHGKPSASFGANFFQTSSELVATKVKEALEILGDSRYFPYKSPAPLSVGEIEKIVDAAGKVPLVDIVDIELFLLETANPQDDSMSLPRKQVFSEGFRQFHLKFDPPESSPIDGEVFWTVERYEPDGTTQEGVYIEKDPGDPTIVTVSVDTLVMGDVVLFLSYETTNGALVFGLPKWVTHQAPLGGELESFDLLPNNITFQVGELFEPELVAVYTDGTRLPRWLDPLSIESVSSSDPEVLSVDNFPNVEALKAGVATLTVNAFGQTAEAQITVESEPATIDFETWKSNFFSAQELEDPSVSGDSLDLDGDSLTLFLEFVTGGDPRIPNPGYLPQITEISLGSESLPVISLRISTRVAGETMTAQQSNDLSVWNEMVELSDSTALGSATIIDYIEGDGYREVFLELDKETPIFYRLLIQSDGD